MKKRLKLKPFVLPLLYSFFVVALIFTVFISRNKYVSNLEQIDNEIYVTSSILDSYIPVINMEETIKRPYIRENIKIGKDYYNVNDTDEQKANSIVIYENTYMPNSGIDYIEETNTIFEVVSILDGEVIEVKSEELLGNIVTIRHTNDIISVYQSLSEVNVKKGDNVSGGQIIGKSGTSKLNKDLNNHLHFELIIDGQLQDPEDFFDKKVSDIK